MLNNPVTETRIVDRRTGDEVIITENAPNDFEAYWVNGDCSVRGTLDQIMEEIYGGKNMVNGKRMNGEHEIIVAVPVDDNTEVVIGKRNTDFMPFVVWVCFNKTSYNWGDYCDSYNDALDCMINKIKRQMRRA